MDFDWHAEKEATVLAARGFGFAQAIRIFAGRIIGWQDKRQDYGEVRMIAIGRVESDFYTVVYTDRVDDEGRPVRWIITAWPSHRKERAAWLRSA